jgi:hypothetical protein
MDLDPTNFSDETFDSFIQIKPSHATDDNSTGSKRKIKNAEMMTDEIYYRDADTNTKHKKESISV